MAPFPTLPWTVGKSHRLRQHASQTLDVLFPRLCFGCDTPLEGPDPPTPRLDTWLCRPCQTSLPLIEPPYCSHCGEPYPGDLTHDFRCWNCQDLHFNFDFATSGYRAEGLIRDLIHAFKYENHYELRGLLAVLLRQSLTDKRLTDLPDLTTDWLLVPVPLHPWREMLRGYNQSRELAIELSRTTGIPTQNALRRSRYTLAQAGLDRDRRLRNLRSAFSLRSNHTVRGRRILLIDDVLTTGSTAQECARVLQRDGGAEKVVVITVARG
jgi:ComF family protein